MSSSLVSTGLGRKSDRVYGTTHIGSTQTGSSLVIRLLATSRDPLENVPHHLDLRILQETINRLT